MYDIPFQITAALVKLVGELCEKNKYEENCFHAAIEFAQRPIISYVS